MPPRKSGSNDNNFKKDVSPHHIPPSPQQFVRPYGLKPAAKHPPSPLRLVAANHRAAYRPPK